MRKIFSNFVCCLLRKSELQDGEIIIKINKITFRSISFACVEFVTDEGAKKSIEVTILIKTQNNQKPEIKIIKIYFFPIGFAFVEFATDEGAKKSIEGFVLAKRKIPVDLDPGELQSIKSYQIEKDQEQKASEDSSEPPKKKAKIQIKEEEEKEKEKSLEKSEEKGETTEGTLILLQLLQNI